MNYSKNERVKESKERSSNKKRVKKKTNILAFRIILISIILGVFAVMGGALGIFMGIINTAPDISKLSLKPTTNYTSFIYDVNGVEMDRLSGGENRIYATIDQIPVHLQKAFIAIEDERFEDHNGIDIRGIFRAIVKNLQTGKLSEGASTITQQLIKNKLLEQGLTEKGKHFDRKIQEQFLALQFEKIYQKDQILEYYLNTAGLGHGEYGVQAAANRYFNKDVSDLTLSESVVIACITQRPNFYSPILNPDNNREKSEVILRKMFEQGYITEAEKQAALDDNPYARIAKINQQFVDQSSHSYFVDQVVEDLVKDLQIEQGISVTEANNLIYRGGLQIYTTLNPEIQAIVDEHISNPDMYPPNSFELEISYSASVKKADGTNQNYGGKGIVKNEDGIPTFIKAKLNDWGITDADTIERETIFKIPQPQAAITIMDFHNGHVAALSGGRGDKVGDRLFNRATQAKRQPGSAFKVLASYAPGIDTGVLSPGSIIVDEPLSIDIPGQKTYTPQNWYSGYRGPSTVRQGIIDSMNIVAVKALQTVGIETAYDYLMRFGFTTLTPQDKVYSLSLGGITDGVTPLELTAAYGAIANNGVYVEPILYTKVLDKDGNLLLDNEPESHTVIKESTAYMLTNMMEDAVNKGTGARIRNTFKGMPVSGKTGTTSDDKDLIFAGYTPYYVAGIWMGHDQPKRLKYSHSYHLDLWAAIMRDIHEDLPVKAFPQVPGLTQVSICGVSGKLATELCKHDSDGSTVTSDFYTKDHLPTEYCDVHVEADVCTVSGQIANEFCPPETVTRKIIAKSASEDESEDVCHIHTSETTMEVPEVETPSDDEIIPWPPDTDFPWPEPDEPFEPMEPMIPIEPEKPEVPDSIDDFFIPQT